MQWASRGDSLEQAHILRGVSVACRPCYHVHPDVTRFQVWLYSALFTKAMPFAFDLAKAA